MSHGLQKRLLFVEQFYYPDGWGGAELPLDLTIHLARSGFDVEVICGSDRYAPMHGKPRADPTAFGIRVRRIPALMRGSARRAKLIRQLWFYAALLPLLLLRRPPNLFVSQTNPPLGVIAVAAAARLWRKPLIIIAMDIYPEVLVAHGAIKRKGIAAAILTRAFAWAYSSARRVVALGPIMTERLQFKGVDRARIIEIPNWATGAPGLVSGAENSLRTEWGLDGKFVVLYSGNLGVAHEFETLLQGAARVQRALTRLRLIFIGGGSKLAGVKKRVGGLGIESIVQFHDFVPAERLPESLGLAHVAVVTLRPGFEGLVVPSKLQGYMARGIPVLYIGPRSDVGQYVDKSCGGVCIRSDDAAGVEAALTDLATNPQSLAVLGRQGMQFYDAEFAKSRGLERYEAVIRSVLSEDAAPS